MDLTIFKNAANKLRYNQKVFILPFWSDIYENDDERKMTLEQSEQFSKDLYEIYDYLGYELIEVPKIVPSHRAEYILTKIQ